MSEPAYDLGDWFSNNIPNWELWLAEFKGKRVHAIEIGSCEGRSARWLLENVLTNPGSVLACVDINLRPQLLENLKPWSGRVQFAQGESREWWRAIVGYRWGMSDLVYIDGSHHARDVFSDSAFAWEVLKPGGILIWDDYRYGPADDPTASEWDRPGPAIDAFLSAYREELKLLAESPRALNPGWQKAVRKRSSR